MDGAGVEEVVIVKGEIIKGPKRDFAKTTLDLLAVEERSFPSICRSHSYLVVICN